MKKNKMIWTAVAIFAAAAGVAAYYIRKQQVQEEHPSNKNKKRSTHLTDVFARAKHQSSGEFTL